MTVQDIAYVNRIHPEEGAGRLGEQQQRVIRGIVTDSNTGELLPGVSVQVRGTTIGTITQKDGTYVLTIPADAGILIFSLVGYQTQEISIGSQSVIDVVMVSETADLYERVLTGYTFERQKDIIGSVSIVNTDDMLRTPSGFAAAQLQGRVAGVSVSNEGSVNASPRVRIRGFGSFGGSDPLYIIDGVPGHIDRLNPNDIESVQILKDAASASIYGARAANGVVIITTRQGKAGSWKLDVDYYFGVNYVSENDFPDLLSAEEMGELYWLQMTGAGRSYGDGNWWHPQYGRGPEPVIPEYILVNINGSRTGGTVLEELKISNPALFAEYVDPENYDFETHQIVKAGNTNWFDEVYNPASMQNIQFTLSGGKERINYLMTANYFKRNQTSDNYTYFKRYSLRANTSYHGSVLQFGENLQITYSEGRNAGNGNAWNMPSLCPVYDIAGNPASSAAPGIEGTSGGNPVTNAWRNRFDGNYYYNIFGNAFVDISFLKDVVLHSSFGMDYYTGISKNYIQATYEHAENLPSPSRLAKDWGDEMTWIFSNTLKYLKVYGSHEIKVLIGTEGIKTILRDFTSTKEANELDNNPDPNEIIQQETGTSDVFSWFSLFGRVDYNLAGKYLFNATLRRDRSSELDDNERYNYFHAFAIGWRISGEGFMNNLTWLTDLKLRAGYGVAGNLNGVMERVITTNVGYDALLFSGGLSMSFDYFIRRSKDLLVGSPSADPLIYTGKMQNKGIDLTVTRRGRIAGILDYEITGNFSAYKNDVLKVLDSPESNITGGGTRMGSVTLTKQGYPMAMFYGYKIKGFFNSQSDVDAYNATITSTWLPPVVGRWKIQDINNDHIINDYDRTYMGDPHPDFQVGLNFSMTYKSFDLRCFMFWSQGGELFNLIRYNVDFNTFQYNRSARMLYDSWTPENTNASLPKHDLNDIFSNMYATDYFIEDATYVRLKQIQIGYTIPFEILNRLKINKIRIYIQAENIWTYAPGFSGLDQDIGFSGNNDLSMGIYNGTTPSPKQILFGAHVGL